MASIAKPRDDDCQRTFKAALWCLKNKTSFPSMFLREIAMTAKCDHVHDMSKLRAQIEDDLGKDVMTRIVNYEEEREDDQRAAQVMFRYREAATTELTKATKSMTWPLALALGVVLGWIGLAV